MHISASAKETHDGMNIIIHHVADLLSHLKCTFACLFTIIKHKHHPLMWQASDPYITPLSLETAFILVKSTNISGVSTLFSTYKDVDSLWSSSSGSYNSQPHCYNASHKWGRFWQFCLPQPKHGTDCHWCIHGWNSRRSSTEYFVDLAVSCWRVWVKSSNLLPRCTGTWCCCYWYLLDQQMWWHYYSSILHYGQPMWLQWYRCLDEDWTTEHDWSYPELSFWYGSDCRSSLMLS